MVMHCGIPRFRQQDATLEVETKMDVRL
jgi:hypothetical protein